MRSALRAAPAFRMNLAAARPENRVRDLTPLSAQQRACVDWVEAVCLPIAAMDSDGAAPPLDLLGRPRLRGLQAAAGYQPVGRCPDHPGPDR
ncbi:hypothetical protein J0910_30180 [Nocardiopsis sp. CNT-189]|uniref:hypothetical protein n=1 Tax=Nocardiopsis oceanisediminis TaxID=2816862 RepID=UPI003B2C94E7